MLGETPWVDRNLRSAFERIAQHVPETWMPREKPSSGRHPAYEEFACGHYGCVMPTNEPGIVMKLTTDISEAGFVARALELPKVTGITEYKKIFALEGQKHKGRQLFVLWRSEAQDIGILIKIISSHPKASVVLGKGYGDYDLRTIAEGVSYLRQFLDNAKIVRAWITPRMRGSLEERRAFLTEMKAAYDRAEYNQIEKKNEYFRDVLVFEPSKWQKGMPRAATALANCYALSENLENTAIVYPIGRALNHYMDQGILLADVHLNNIGMSDEGEYIITDPGHAVEFDPRWAEQPQVPVI